MGYKTPWKDRCTISETNAITGSDGAARLPDFITLLWGLCEIPVTSYGPYLHSRSWTCLQLRLMQGVSWNTNDINLILVIFPRKGVHCKLGPVHDYKHGVLKARWSHGLWARHRIERSWFEPWAGTLCGVLEQILSQCLPHPAVQVGTGELAGGNPAMD